MKTFIITISDVYDDPREIGVRAKSKNEAMLKFLWWQLQGVKIQEKKFRKRKTK